jgi:hypothetical protein
VSRTRLVRPAFFSDELMARLPAWTRLVYVGLWTITDDAGYFERRPAEIAAELFRYDRPATRLRRVQVALDELVVAGRVTWLDCGEHGIVPTLPRYGVIKGGNHAYTSRERHESVCQLTLFRRRQAGFTRNALSTSTDVSQTSHVSGSVSESGSGSVSESGRAARKSETTEKSELRRRAPWPNAAKATA